MKLYYNGIIYVGEGKFADAFTVENGRFQWVGSGDEARSLVDSGRVAASDAEDLRGAFVAPGFNDSHMHLLNYGQALAAAQLSEHTRSLGDMVRYFKEYAEGKIASWEGSGDGAQSPWILGRGWNEDYFADERRMPNRRDLDRVTTEYPVVAVRACGHCLATNSKALEVLEIDGKTEAPEGGRIGVEDGEPDGLFFDNAMDLVLPKAPAPDLEALKDMLCDAARQLSKYGVTSCQTDDYCVFRQVPWQTVDRAYRELAQEGKLTVRVYEQCNFTSLEELKGFVEAGNVTGAGDERFRYGPLKMLGDGSLGAGTALMSRPYADDPEGKNGNDKDGYGLAVFDQKTMDEMVGYANAHHMQVAIHAIGDRCLDMVLDACGRALKENPREDHRHGVVHCQITRPDQLERIAGLNMQVYAQSIFLDYDINIVEDRVGKELASTSYTWKSLMKKGVNVSNGTDCPVELPDALACMQCGVTRRRLDGKGMTYLPEEAFTVREALDSYTICGARASFEEDVKGTIEVGKLADFVILEKSPFDVDESAIAKIKVLRTVLGGDTVYGG